MLLIVVFSVVFILSFGLLFNWIRKDNEQEPDNKKMHIFLIIFTALMLALLLAGVASFFLFLVLGSTSVINTLFSLNMSKKDLILMSFVYLIFLFTLDNIFQILIKLLTANIYLFHFIMLWIRMIAFYFIGTLFHLSHYTNMFLSGGVALLLTLIELFFELSQKKE